MRPNKLLVIGDPDTITQVVDFIKEKNLIHKDKLNVVDLFPELSKDYIEENELEEYFKDE